MRRNGEISEGLGEIELNHVETLLLEGSKYLILRGHSKQLVYDLSRYYQADVDQQYFESEEHDNFATVWKFFAWKSARRASTYWLLDEGNVVGFMWAENVTNRSDHYKDLHLRLFTEDNLTPKALDEIVTSVSKNYKRDSSKSRLALASVRSNQLTEEDPTL